MKVLLVVHQYLPRHVTGTEQYVRSIAHGLQAQGEHVEILTCLKRAGIHALERRRGGCRVTAAIG